MSSSIATSAPTVHDGEIPDADLEAVAGGTGFFPDGNTLIAKSILSNTISALVETSGPVGLGGAVVAGAAYTLDNNAQAQQSGVSSHSVAHEVGHQISSFFKHAFHGW
jgi:hypothetical protein